MSDFRLIRSTVESRTSTRTLTPTARSHDSRDVSNQACLRFLTLFTFTHVRIQPFHTVVTGGCPNMFTSTDSVYVYQKDQAFRHMIIRWQLLNQCLNTVCQSSIRLVSHYLFYFQ